MATDLRFAVAALLVLGACGGDDLLLPRDGEPARIAPIHGTSQSDTVAQALAESLVVEVTDPAGRPVPNIEVQFVVPAGAAVAPGDRIKTGSDGRAGVHYTLGTVAGEQIVEAHAPIVPETNAVTTFTILAQPDTPQALIPAGGDIQRAEVSTVLPESLAVQAVDRFKNGVAGIEVTWDASGGGDVSPARVMTGADGKAKTARTLGAQPGSYGSTAQAEGLEGSPVSFTSTAVAPPSPALILITQPSPAAAAGVPLEQQPQIQLQDAFGAPLNQEGVSVTVQVAGGDGSVGGRTTATSDAGGRVAFTDLELRGEIGTRRLIFAAEGFTPVTSSDITLRPGPPAAGQSSLSAPGGTAGTATPITIRLRDEFGNNIPDAAADVTIRVSGANSESSIPVADNGNGSYTASYVPVHSGADALTIMFRGEPVGQAVQSLVSPGPADASTSSAVVTRTGIFFVRVDVLVTARDRQGNPVGRGGDQVQITANGGSTRTCAPPDGDDSTCVDNGDGTYVDSFVIIAGEVSVVITLNGVPLAGSPFTP